MSLLTQKIAPLTNTAAADDYGFAAQDLGSTETRTVLFSRELEFDEIVKLDSNFARINRDISYINSADLSIGANLELLITDNTASHKVQPAFEKIRIVKGGLLGQITQDRQATTASASKIDQDSTYINSIANLAISLLGRYYLVGKPAKIPELILSVSLPPEDTTSTARLATFKERLAGSYSVEFVRIGVTVDFILTADNIDVTSEPNAVAVVQAVNKKVTSDDVIGFIDIGGRSAGITFTENGQLLEDSCVTVPTGGSNLVTAFSKFVSEQYNVQRPNSRMLASALSTGRMKIGSHEIDVTESLNKAKAQIAEAIFSAIMTALDTNNLQAQQVARFFCSGRSFGSAEGSPSIMAFLSEEYAKRTPYTDFELIDIEDPIISGLMYKAVFNA